MSQDASEADDAAGAAATEEALPPPARFDCTGSDPDALAAGTEAARQAVEAGECIVLPTDTVYGIGVDAFSAEAVQRLLEAKNRGRDMPPPVLLGEASLIQALATDVPAAARELVAVHWPGALTIICRIQPSLRMDLGDTEGTIALRVPDHALAREILRRTGPMAVSSANLSGRPAALSCDEALDQLGERASVYLDGGFLDAGNETARHGTPSTIVDFTVHEDGEIRRRGALDLETLRATVPGLRDLDAPPPTESEAGTELDDPDADPYTPGRELDDPDADPYAPGRELDDPDADPYAPGPELNDSDAGPYDPDADPYDPDADPDQPGLFDETFDPLADPSTGDVSRGVGD